MCKNSLTVTITHHLTFIGRFFFRIEFIREIEALYSSGAIFDMSCCGNSVLNLFDRPNLKHRERKMYSTVAASQFSLCFEKLSYMVTSPIPRTIMGSPWSVCSAGSSSSSSTYIASKSLIIHEKYTRVWNARFFSLLLRAESHFVSKTIYQQNPIFVNKLIDFTLNSVWWEKIREVSRQNLFNLRVFNVCPLDYFCGEKWNFLQFFWVMFRWKIFVDLTGCHNIWIVVIDWIF